ncbi:hypothetical protein KL937_000421 [Ogataea polymorpha]|uniref:uncharacterized protein n=1 Tax=Ogataea polymorpha TaxID=460523 RepID=UPI0007F41F8C|nr:uncharacterized protein OGAPODRAFT_101185 [Ogataea polymorpha]KAG7883248.1 hypothetical protein KL937_000421 [Ogataea polymorpha]KAG7940262.1 hypothetical protein KL904_000125 [Ogataea polymorpha]OBA14744.1 hypothetical protein OGAPODRAFT_101185 [Ogataea polymorpha]
MGRYSVKRYKTKRRTRDLDLIHSDLSTEESIQSLKHQPQDETKPGLGQYYCIHCAKYFLDNKALGAHLKGKVHKRRVKNLSKLPYTQLEAEAAAGTNLNKYIEKVNEYQQKEPARLELKKQLLSTQLEENDQKDSLAQQEFAGEMAVE